MAALSHVDMWQSETFSDATVLVKLSLKGSSAEVMPMKVLRRLPGHRVLLCASPVLRAQLERWQPEIASPCKRIRLRSEAKTDTRQHSRDQQSDKQQPEAIVIIDSEDQEPAAMAVLASLYGVSTTPEQLTALQHLHMAVLADMLQVPTVAEAAVNNLVGIAADSANGLSDAAKQCLCKMAAWPSCLLDALPSLTRQLPLHAAADIWAQAAAPSSPSSLEAVQAAPDSSYMQDRLLQELGDLEEVWRDAEKQKQLLGLPLAAMQLLLASSKLKVATEDTVLFTAQTYTAREPRQCTAAQQQLAQLIRCPYLSAFWLTAAARTTEDQLLLAPMKDQLLELLAFRQVRPIFSTAVQEQFKQGARDAPSSWLLGARQLARRQPVRLSWELPVSQVKECCLKAFAEKTPVGQYNPECSAPLRGMSFRLMLECRYEPH